MTPTHHVLDDSNSGEPDTPPEEKPSRQSADEESSADQDALKQVLRVHDRRRQRRKHERLSVTTTVRFTPADVEEIEARAASLGLSFSTYVRTATLAAGEEPLLGALFADRFQDTLSRIRNRLIAQTKAAVRTELKDRFEPTDTKKAGSRETSEEQAGTPDEPSALDLSRAILRVIVPTVEEEMERIEETLEELRRQYPAHTEAASRENLGESSGAGDAGDDEE
ncbi:MAG: hypothetical protein GVY12_16615 [Bacteroidetes bacterium]|nr:hypothetical protein [Bacteroidota bacterium]